MVVELLQKDPCDGLANLQEGAAYVLDALLDCVVNSLGSPHHLRIGLPIPQSEAVAYCRAEGRRGQTQARVFGEGFEVPCAPASARPVH